MVPIGNQTLVCPMIPLTSNLIAIRVSKEAEVVQLTQLVKAALYATNPFPLSKPT